MNTTESLAAKRADDFDAADWNAQIQARRPARPGKGALTVVKSFTAKSLFSVWAIFTFGMPIIMYLIFGTRSDTVAIDLPHGNVSALVLISMAQFAAVVNTAMSGAQIGLERIQGWLRTMALTPLGAGTYVWCRAISTIVTTAVEVLLVYLVGFFGKAEMDPSVWVITFLLIIVSSIVPSLLGIATGLLVGGEQSFGLLGGGTALLAFLSGMFIPLEFLSEFFQKLARFTPFWGLNNLAQLPVVGWDQFEWAYAVNFFAWLAIFAAGAWWGAVRAIRR